MQDMMKDGTNDLLPWLREEIERAWNARRDHVLVHQLAAEHPSLANELYDFFADVIEAQSDLGRNRPELAEGARRIREYLKQEGYKHAAGARSLAVGSTEPLTAPSAPTTPRKVAEPAVRTSSRGRTTFLALLRSTTGESVEALASKLEVTPDFLVVLSENGSSVPPKARKELVNRVRKSHSLNESELMASFGVGPEPQRVAASRPRAFDPKDNVNFAKLVKSSSLTADQKKYWLGLE